MTQTLEKPTLVSFALALQERRRRAEQDGVRRYIPHIKQLPFHKSQKRIRAIFGGNRSGKSVAGTAEGAWWATGLHPYRRVPIPNFGRVCTIDLTNYLERIIIPEYKRWIPKDFLKGGSWDIAYKREPRILYLTNGSTIEFMSYDQDLEKFGGSSRHWVHEDEECPSDKHHENMMRLIDTNGACWITMTPLKGMTWVYAELYEAPADHPVVDTFTIDIVDNPHLDPKTIDEILSTFPEDEVDARRHGTFIRLSGLVYRSFNRSTHVIPWGKLNPSWIRICGIDPHPRKPTACVWIAVNQHDEYIIYDELKSRELFTIKEVADKIKEKEGGFPARYRVIDTSANDPDPVHGITIRREFERHGIRTILATKDIEPGLNWVKELLSLQPTRLDSRILRPRLFFMDNCVLTLREIEHYIYDEFRGPNPDWADQKQLPLKKNDDLMDAMRYALLTKPKFDAPRIYRPTRATRDPDSGY